MSRLPSHPPMPGIPDNPFASGHADMPTPPAPAPPPPHIGHENMPTPPPPPPESPPARAGGESAAPGGVDWSQCILPGALGLGGLYALHRYMQRPDDEEEQKYGAEGLLGRLGQLGRKAWGASKTPLLPRGSFGGAVDQLGVIGAGGAASLGVSKLLEARGGDGGESVRGQHLDRQLAATDAGIPELASTKAPQTAAMVGPPRPPEPSLWDTAKDYAGQAWGAVKPHLGPLGQPIEDHPYLTAGALGAGGLGLMAMLNQGGDDEEEEDRRRGKYGQFGGLDDDADGAVPRAIRQGVVDDRSREAMYDLAKMVALGGGSLGGSLGAGMSPRGHRMEGTARGITAGLGTGIGGLLGGLGGAAMGERAGGMLPAAAAGVGIGGIGGHALANKLMGRPSWEDDKEAAASTPFFTRRPPA